MHTSSQTTKLPPLIYLSLSLVILGAAIFQCILAVLQSFLANRATSNTHNAGDMRTMFIYRCEEVLAFLLSIGLVVFSGLLFRSLSSFDWDRFDAIQLAFLVAILRVHLVCELQFIRFTLNKTNNLYQYAVWIGYGYCVILLVGLSSLIGLGISKIIVIEISLGLSSVEYIITAFGHVSIYRQFLYPPGRRLLFFFIGNITFCFAAGVFALVPVISNLLVNINLELFQWIYTIVASIFMLRFRVFTHTKDMLIIPSPTYATRDLSTSLSDLIDYEGGRPKVKSRLAITDREWVQFTAYRSSVDWVEINEGSTQYCANEAKSKSNDIAKELA